MKQAEGHAIPLVSLQREVRVHSKLLDLRWIPLKSNYLIENNISLGRIEGRIIETYR